ncbi:MAG: hypothetical protein ACYTGZ_04305 [Planctomycetota bacterium]|jgi:hypothetical protein
MVAASLTYAAQMDAMLPSTGDFTVVASLTPGANGGSVEFGTGWEDDIELSIGIDSSGKISVNGEQVGSMGSATSVRVTVICDRNPAGDFTANVRVVCGASGDHLAAKSGVLVSGDVETVSAEGASVSGLLVD